MRQHHALRQARRAGRVGQRHERLGGVDDRSVGGSPRPPEGPRMASRPRPRRRRTPPRRPALGGLARRLQERRDREQERGAGVRELVARPRRRTRAGSSSSPRRRRGATPWKATAYSGRLGLRMPKTSPGPKPLRGQRRGHALDARGEHAVGHVRPLAPSMSAGLSPRAAAPSRTKVGSRTSGTESGAPVYIAGGETEEGRNKETGLSARRGARGRGFELGRGYPLSALGIGASVELQRLCRGRRAEEVVRLARSVLLISGGQSKPPFQACLLGGRYGRARSLWRGTSSSRQRLTPAAPKKKCRAA